MKKNILLIVTIALVAVATLTLTSLRAQTDATPGAPPAGQTPPQGTRSGPPPGLRNRMLGNSYRQAVYILKRAQMDLKRATDDYDGHRQSAIDACDKAIKELEAVQTSIQAAAAVAAKAAQPAPAPTPAPAPATTNQ